MTADAPAPRFGRNTVILLTSSVSASALGFFYWMVAERSFGTASVGHASTIVASATMLGTIGGLALGSMFERFTTSLGHHARRAVVLGAGITLTASALLGAVFSIVDPIPALFATSQERWAFALVTASFGLFAFCDPVLVGLREARLVALKNNAVAVAKLLVLLVVPTTGAAWIYGTWTALALAASVALISWTIGIGVRSVLREEVALPRRGVLLAHHRAVLSLMLVSTVVPTLLPLFVIARLGPESAAHFNIAAIIITATAMIDGAIGSAYVSDAGHPGIDTARTTRRLVYAKALTVGATVLSLAVVGPFMLSLVGPEYAREAGGYLRLMAIGASFQVLVGLYALLCRIESRLTLVTRVQICVVAAIVAGSWWALPRWGLVGIGWTFVIVEAIFVAIVARPCLASLRRLLHRPVLHAPMPERLTTDPTEKASR